MRTRALAVLIPTVLVLLSACNGGSGQDADGGASVFPNPTRSASPSGSPSATPSTIPSDSSPTSSTPEALPEAEGVDDENILDPCTMMSQEYVQSLVPEKRRSQLMYDRELGKNLTILTRSDKTRYSCVLSLRDTDKTVISWGYFPEPFSGPKIEKMLSESGGTDVTQKVGFTAALTGDILSSEAYGLMNGDFAFFVFVDESLESLEGKEARTSKKVMLAHLKEMGRGAYYAYTQQPIDTPSYCPTAKSSAVKAPFGHVDVARGARDTGVRTWCLYRNEKDFSNLKMVAIQAPDDANFAILLDFVKNGPDKGKRIRGPQGVVTSVLITDGGEASVEYADPNRRIWVGTTISYISSKKRPRRDRKAVIALIKAYADLLPPR